MKKLFNNLLIYSDSNYNKAVNYSGESFYNSPITLNIGEKHNRVKYIISAGTNDNITILQDGVFVYVIAQNNGLSYIGMQEFNTETKEEINSVFLNEQDTECDGGHLSNGILELDEIEQYKILCEYL